MPGRYILNTQYITRHNQEIVCHQLLYVLLIFISDCKYELKFLNVQIFFKPHDKTNITIKRIWISFLNNSNLRNKRF